MLHRFVKAPAVVAIGVSIVGCAFGDGTAFTEVTMELEASFAAMTGTTSRLTDDGWLKTSQSFGLKLQTAELQVRNIKVSGSAGGAASASSGSDCTLDPADPPAGCTLCHGGHCHCGDELVDYETLAAQVCGGGNSSSDVTLATVQGAENIPLKGAAESISLGDCSPSCDLAAGQLTRSSVAFGTLKINGELKDLSVAERLGGETLSFSVDYDLAGAAIAADFEPAFVLNRDAPASATIEFRLVITEKLFDDLAFEEAEQIDSAISISSSSNSALADNIVKNMSASIADLNIRGE